MAFTLQMIGQTPAYVWALLTYLIWHGARSMLTSTQAVWRLLLVPAVFAATGLALTIGRPDIGMTTAAAWIAGMLALLPVGVATGPRLIAVDRRTGMVTRASSVVPLARNLLVFSLQYGMAVATAVKVGERALLSPPTRYQAHRLGTSPVGPSRFGVATSIPKPNTATWPAPFSHQRG